jgi:hypothetical protein
MPGMIDGNSLAHIRENKEKSLRLAALLFPDETWVYKEPNIYVAKSRLIEEYREKEKWEREMSQVRILTSRGSVAYFLPERQKQRNPAQLCADLVLDGIETPGQLYSWRYEELKALIGGDKKSPGPA